ncbi:hypothetical protein ACFVYP_23745 [Kitasatospora sp. NPDC058201]|uniref:hypothetical protein n=1 Tax=unclassified Kitasatospora TaxID=2633591 RepID=UPI00365A2979
MTLPSPRNPSSPAGGDPRRGVLDAALVDRVTDAVLFAGLPVAFGDQGPGVRIRPAEAVDAADRCEGLAALDWLPSRRLADAAAMEDPQHAAGSARQVVGVSMVNALAEFLPAFGLDVSRDRSGRELRVGGAADSGLRVPPDVLVRRPAGATPAELGLDAELVDAVRRSAALAGLPVAGHLGAAGVTLGPWPTGEDGTGGDGGADIGWNPSRRLSDLADSGSPAAGLAAVARTSVHAAMLHALGTILGACGTELRWFHARNRLRALGESTPAIRH